MRYFFYLIIVLSFAGCKNIPPTQVQPPSHGNLSAVVSDIDGTLTPDVLAVNEIRPGAAEALGALSNKGYKIIYITTRVPFFQSGLPEWLKENGFPEGALHVAQSGEERHRPEIFKTSILKEYAQQGWKLEYAYGDSSSDFAAYAGAGIPKERVFALRRRGSENCQEGIYRECLKGWKEHLPYIEKEIVTRK